MFERFRACYGPRRDSVSTARAAWHDARLQRVEGYDEFAAEFAGATFVGGVYRVHDERTGPRGLALIRDAFPELGGRVRPFGYDWLGRQFAIDAARVENGEPQVLLLEPGTGEALEVPVSFVDFHEQELIDYPDACLALEYFHDWARANDDSLPLSQDQCAGYQVPLFLGGKDGVENLEVGDIDVYWSFCGQLRRGVRGLPPGTPISGVTAD